MFRPTPIDRAPVVFTLALAFAFSATFGTSARDSAAEGASPGLVPLPDAAPKVALAPPMGELQRLTHKLSLSVGAGNLPLTSFYAYECLELLRTIQHEIPEYDGQPIALLIDRMAVPAFDALTGALRSAEESPTAERRAAVDRAVTGVIAACNGCHEATKHELLRITDERARNPFNQRFEP